MNTGRLVPKRSLVSGKPCPEEILICEVMSLAKDSSLIALKVAPGMLEKASLDAVYELTLQGESEKLKAEGCLLRRDQSSRGDVIIFHIRQGLYRS